MNIIDIEFVDNTNTTLKVTTDEGTMFTSYPCHNYLATFINKWLVNNVIKDAPLPPPVVVEVPKLKIVDRLQQAGLLQTAMVALESDFYMYQRWLASTSIFSNDAIVRGFLTTVGADPDQILAP